MNYKPVLHRCGHPVLKWIFVLKEMESLYTHRDCVDCQMVKEQLQFEEAISRSERVYCVTDQNGCRLTATRLRPGFCQITRHYIGEPPYSTLEVAITHVTQELYSRYYHGLYWLERSFWPE